MTINKQQAQVIISAIEYAYEGKENAQLSNEGIIFLAETQAYLVSKLLPIDKKVIEEIIKDRMIKQIK